MTLDEFAFGLDANLTAGNVAFAVENQGEQPHEAILAKIDEGVDLEEALNSEEDEPEGIEVLGGVFEVQPGNSYNLVYTEELEAGRYAFVCFLPDLDEGPDGTPHALKGMVLEFNIE